MVDRRFSQAIARRTQARRRMWFDMNIGLTESQQSPRATELEISVHQGDGAEFTMTVPIGKERG